MTSLTQDDIIPEDELVENGEVPTRSEDENPGLKKRNNRLSTISQKYDTGNKGYLDEDEAVLRKYDSANAGELSDADLRRIAQDFRGEKKQKELLKKIAGAALAVSIIVILCNFGLVWTALIITREVETKDGSLVDSNGKKVSTKVGQHAVATINPEFTRRLLNLQGRRALSKVGIDSDFDYHGEYRRLTQEVPVANLEETPDGVMTLFLDYVDGTPITITIDADGVTHTGQVAPGVTLEHRVEDDCDVFDNIIDTNNQSGPYRVHCCAAETACQVYEIFASNNRHLPVNDYGTCTTDANCPGDMVCGISDCGESTCFPRCTTDADCPEPGDACEYNRCKLQNECFSPMSNVIEKSKGVMPIKDLKHGDSVLAANGKFQPFVLSSHSSPSKPTQFLQIHTDSSKDSSAPLEVTPNHFVFLHDKDLPVPAGKVKVGDLMAGIDGPVTVTKISSITRNGFYNALTRDATLFVDGILASSTATLNGDEGEEYVSFGPFQVHVHTLSSWIAAPLIHSQCSMITSFFCETQVDDGSGGTRDVLGHLFAYVLTLPQVLQGLVLPLFAAIVVVGIVSYYLALVLGAGTIVLGIQFLALKCEKKKEKMA